jgi:hypothetical protein
MQVVGGDHGCGGDDGVDNFKKMANTFETHL